MNNNLYSEENIVEPRLKYNRVPNYAKEILSKDSISCIAVHSKFIVVGTEWGNIYVLDHCGNASSKKEINAHSTTINQISIDSSGEYIASCSNDGKVMIFGLLDEKRYPVLSFNQEIKAIAISPDFKRTFQFVTGDTRLLLVSKGLLSTHKHKIIQENRTLIRNIKWNRNIIVYATEDKVLVFDMKEQKLIGIIDPDINNLVSNIQEFFCRIVWINNKTFMIGWGHLVQICMIKDTQPVASSIKQLDFQIVNKLNYNSKKVESLHSFSLPDMILGVVPYGKYVLAVIDPVLTSMTDEYSEVSKPQPLVVILEPNNSSPEGFIELSSEQINLKDYETSKYHKIHLDKIPDENEFYIVSSKDLICARERELNDKIEWFIQKKLFDRALELVKNTDSKLTKYSYKDIGILYIDYLMQISEFSKAAEMCNIILVDTELWEKFISKFLLCECIEMLLDYIPHTKDLQLNQSTYMGILENRFNNNLESFLYILKMWPCFLYSITGVINIILKNEENQRLFSRKPNEKLTKPMEIREKIILECLGILYDHNQEYENSLNYYFRLKSKYVFQLIPKRKMFDFVKEKLVLLFNYDKDETLKMLMEYINDISPETIVKILAPTPIWLFHYLNTLGTHNTLASEPYHLQMVTLYAEFKSESLLSFLKSSDKYDLNSAIELCKNKKFNKEVIYLLGRVGKSKDALKMIMSQENSVYEAIDYCHERADEDLWRQLMSFSTDKPNFIKAILENSGIDIDVKTFIRKILNGIEIPGLKDSLVILLINNEKRNNLICAHQIGRWNDIFAMIQKRFQYSTKPIICDFVKNDKCVICFKSIVNCTSGFVIFPCSHFTHESCIKEGEIDSPLCCPFCKDL